jgi:hypothetical protein
MPIGFLKGEKIMALNRKWMLVTILLSWVSFIALVIPALPLAADPAQGDLITHLPFVATQPGGLGIYGRITESGVPVPGVSISLRRHDGNDWTTAATVITDDKAEYHFLDMPALLPGHIYNVLYVNPENNPDRVISWIGYFITGYTAGADIFGGDIDLADAQPVTPTAGMTVTLPATFTWQPRSIPTDSYEFELFAEGGTPYFYSNPALGYTNSYTLTSLPPGFQYDTEYLWSLVIYGPDGGGETGHYGFSNWANGITFTETAAIPAPPTPSPANCPASK